MRSPYVIAEIGQNHQGDVYTALRLVSAAVKAGANCVKFQLRDRHAEYTAAELAAVHPRPEHAFGATYGDHRAAIDLSVEELRHIRDRIRYNGWGIDMAVTPCHVSCVAPLREFDMPFWKVASKDHANWELLDRLQSEGPLWVSTGGADLVTLRRTSLYADVLLHCVREYPTPLRNANLGRLRDLAGLGTELGWSDHTGTPYLGAPAVALGAKVLEAHLTFSQQMKGTDHRASLTPADFKLWVQSIRGVYEGLGGSVKQQYSATL